ncbi:Pyrroline-5-carboxylate reductase [Bacidia gigantensis]|uniref:Pyrroline-5-carboxylate reductase n=1 Tax=Bacidia gigantensis TaxID=2732470 RepID=UPI001D04421A|nr:Pyrroline-5-carboxylate reductase [Bacidia gigantensis]KAG8531458.1 Pyrroline-5-carboxylate reductase [Bacidia gigantensis]
MTTTTDGPVPKANANLLSTALPEKRNGITLTILGCGTLGIAILSGILSSLAEQRSPSSSGTATPSEDLPSQIPNKFIGCVTRPASAKRIEKELSHLTDSLTVLQNGNIRGVKEADVVLLGCKPYNLSTVLQEEGMKEALKGKFLISILAGVPVSQIEETIYGPESSKTLPPDPATDGRCRIIRVMPNTAALIRESMTVIATSNPPLPSHLHTLVTWMFQRVGRVVTLPPSQMDACTALCGSGPATFALVLEAIADGAVAMGLPRAEAQFMAAQTMRGASGLVLNGEHPAMVREKVSTPGGCTIGGLLVLEEGSLRGTVARSIREATVVASQLGKGMQGVNGTRF